ncbi:MAG: hypothetical protein A3A96_03275 [Candidatus Zambryskibacteria bacterium RIFCSPLOWO2_01_FULL_39_39]|uniref:RNHCP domain-containing protein n=1 Tax=Candidatus Zambryskibacteria bacterium RIFCSPLOWO2_01_FULL_39_39 TaxID=1802758 RepID=A0A1G2TWX9_9BACT|nr:MAG: hypothetical protein A2644_02665 [Candidatus Zambryskibacteria bacterium RIFCSPHIGHO2_01_FULL_39_63]OHA97920.1 MAG: hypothetical protein A3F20_00575 [Candidatus Zambryskibacteria bacterium RIFCSPHIGHO2_12_FULL_39_21]OHB01659.1 MAG: hypothetical protein A3A96_03275 [Candidatus Zambryskibacteria bacterium RIFCSPLOWO2_01_FULL_39_39]
MSLKFKRKIEDFTCENCGEDVDGNGYTNHCPHCLWSKHVDNFPGDRGADCGGLMCPIDTKESGREWCVIQKCQKCKKIHKNKISTADNFDRLVKINKEKNS